MTDGVCILDLLNPDFFADGCRLQWGLRESVLTGVGEISRRFHRTRFPNFVSSRQHGVQTRDFFAKEETLLAVRGPDKNTVLRLQRNEKSRS